MKKTLLSILVGLLAFITGGFGVLLVHSYNKAEVIVERNILPRYTRDCEESAQTFPGLSRPIDEIKRTKIGLFPTKTFGGSRGSINEWYSKQLRAMNESSLLDISDDGTEVYRFLWLRTFHHPVSVRLERDRYFAQLVSIELNGAGGYEPGTVWRTDNISVSDEQWVEFILLLNKATFWNQETHRRDDAGLDGSQWVLEGVKDGRYHVVDRWSPVSGDYREACLYLLKLSGRDGNVLKDDLY
jgi:hypothetical protein